MQKNSKLAETAQPSFLPVTPTVAVAAASSQPTLMLLMSKMGITSTISTPRNLNDPPKKKLFAAQPKTKKCYVAKLKTEKEVLGLSSDLEFHIG